MLRATQVFSRFAGTPQHQMTNGQFSQDPVIDYQSGSQKIPVISLNLKEHHLDFPLVLSLTYSVL